MNRPNIILFMTDQLRQDVLGGYGNAICKTPNLDRLAGEGTAFDFAYTTSPVCSPARASLLTGLYPHNHGVMLNTHIAPAWCRGLSQEIPTFSRLLKDGGYVLDYVGKWHVHQDRGPEEYGFHRHVTPKVSRQGKPETMVYIDFPGGRQSVCGVLDASKEHSDPWRCTDQGIEFIRERAAGNQPFFLRIDTRAPHFANIVPEPFASQYDPSAIPPWPNFEESFEGKPSAHLRKHREWHLEDKDWTWWQQVVAKYYGDITLVDTCLGRVVDAVEEMGIAANTVVIFASDHGDSMGSHKHFEKAGSMYEEVFRIPLIIKIPGGPVQRISHFARLMDLMPTILELAGIDPPEGIDAVSLLPLLRGEEPARWPDSVYCEHHGEVWGYQTQRMVRTHGWKYVYNPHDGDELYDVKKDPFEMTNRISDPETREVLEEMKGRLMGWNDATGDMFQWNWVRWNFPEPIPPLSGEPRRTRGRLTAGGG